MKKATKNDADEMRPEYDLRGGVRGKYYERYRQGTNIVLLEPDLARVFRDSATVNEALPDGLNPPGSSTISEHGSRFTPHVPPPPTRQTKHEAR